MTTSRSTPTGKLDMTRRSMLITLSAFIAGTPHLFAGPFRRKVTPQPIVPPVVFFGTGGKGIYRSKFDPATGQLSVPELAVDTVRPTFLAVGPLHSGTRTLYSVNEANEAPGTISSFSIDAKTNVLKLLNQVPSAGNGPCYVSVEGSGHSAFVANYGGGTIASFRIQPDGTLSQPVEHIDFHDREKFGRGPNKDRQEGPHPHSVLVSPDNRFLLVNDLGNDSILVYAIDPDDAKLTHTEQYVYRNERPGAGPRHIVFHPNGRWIYGVNELDCTIDHFLWTATRSRTAPEGLLVNTKSTVKTLDPGFTGKNTAAEIAVSPDGYFLYVSNRGEDSLVVFAISAKDGSLKPVQRIACGGKTPRHFALDPSGKWVICTNQDSGNATVFRRDPATGKLDGPVQTVALETPMFTLFV